MGARARLLRVATGALNSEIDLLQACGLLPNNLGTLRVERPTQRLPSGDELRQRFENVHVSPDELVSEAEAAWRYGDQAAEEAAALDATDSDRKKTH